MYTSKFSSVLFLVLIFFFFFLRYNIFLVKLTNGRQSYRKGYVHNINDVHIHLEKFTSSIIITSAGLRETSRVHAHV